MSYIVLSFPAFIKCAISILNNCIVHAVEGTSGVPKIIWVDKVTSKGSYDTRFNNPVILYISSSSISKQANGSHF